MPNWFRRKFNEANLADLAIAFFTLIIAGATICYVVYAKRQWAVMSGQLDATKRTVSILEEQQRPLVMHESSCLIQSGIYHKQKKMPQWWCEPDPVQVLDKAKTHEPITIAVTVQNHGNSTAHIRTLEADWCISYKTDDGPPTLDECRTPVQYAGEASLHNGRVDRWESIFIPAHAEGTSKFGLYTDINWDESWWNQPETCSSPRPSKGCKFFYIIGQVTYDHGRQSEFCLLYRTHEGYYPLRFCHSGNRVDGEEQQSEKPN